MNPFLDDKPRVQRKAELAETRARAADKKKRALDKKRKRARASEVEPTDEELDLALDEYVEEPEEPPKKKKRRRKAPAQAPVDTYDPEELEALAITGEEPEPRKRRRRKKVPEEVASPELSDSPDDWGIAPYEAAPEDEGLTLRKISKMKRPGIRSIIAQDVETIHQLIESDNTDTATTLIYKRMLQTLVDVIGHSEAMIHKSKGARGTHQLTTLVGALRDTMLDLQQAQDRGQLGESLVERIIAPAFLEVGMLVLRENAQMFSRLKRELDPEQADKYSRWLADQEQRVGEEIQRKYQVVRDEVRRFLQR